MKKQKSEQQKINDFRTCRRLAEYLLDDDGQRLTANEIEKMLQERQITADRAFELLRSLMTQNGTPISY